MGKKELMAQASADWARGRAAGYRKSCQASQTTSSAMAPGRSMPRSLRPPQALYRPVWQAVHWVTQWPRLAQ